jgi:hypothetical protein
MEISIPRSALNMTDKTPEFYFHWADNPQHINDITAFFTDGESAPDRRFNYSFNHSDTTTDLNDNRWNPDFAKIYPNPATSRVRIETSESSKVEVYNMIGQKVYMSHNSSKELDMNVSKWKPGIYLIRIKSSTKVCSKKLLVE